VEDTGSFLQALKTKGQKSILTLNSDVLTGEGINSGGNGMVNDRLKSTEAETPLGGCPSFCSVERLPLRVFLKRVELISLTTPQVPRLEKGGESLL